MATLTPITLSGSVGGWTGKDLYGENDGLGLSNQYLRYDAVIGSISAQNHSDSSTREPNLYNGLDIEEGMFISNGDGLTIVKIISISAKNADSFTCVVEDVDMMSYRLNAGNSMSINEGVKIFALNPEGEPVFAGSPFGVQALQRVNSRFSLNEKDDRVKFTHSLATSLNRGDIVTVDTSGNLVKFGTGGAADVKVGIVVDTYRGGKDVFVKPFNDIVRDYGEAESLTGNPGQVYFTDNSNPGEITTTTGGKAIFMHLNNKIATTVNIVSATDPGAGDLITINDITVFDGPNGDSVADTAAFRDLLNTRTAQTNVSAAITQAPGQVNAEGNTMLYAAAWADHDMFIPIGAAGSTPGSYASITIGDGVAAPQTIVFDSPDLVVNLGADYDIMSPSAILAEFQAAITAGGLDLIAELYDSTDHNGQAIQITTTGAATGIFLNNQATDAFGGNVVGSGTSTGLTTTAALGASTLTLTRASGGPIEIDGTPLAGGYINQSGVTSSKNGRVPFLLLIESENPGGVEATGVSFKEEFTPNNTNSDGAATGAAMTYTPFESSNIIVRVNGLQCDVGDGAKDKPTYFSGDGGTTARQLDSIVAGDLLYWMGSIAGYELDNTDDLELQYLASSLDV